MDELIEEELRNDLRDLEAVAKTMRRLGIARLKFRGADIFLAYPEPVEAPAEEPKKDAESEKRSARDGLTREEQIAMYGRVMDADL